MSIELEASIVHLATDRTSYVFEILPSGHLAHLYWGKRVRAAKLSHRIRPQDRAFSPNWDPADQRASLDTLPQEYPAFGNTDFRGPAFQVQSANGSTISDLRYTTHRIRQGKPKLDGLPATYAENAAEAETLEVELVDSVTGLAVTLSYSVFEKWNAITRSVRFENRGGVPLRLLRVLSLSVDFPPADFDFLHLWGAHARERHLQRTRLRPGVQSIESRRGASSHQHNPFIALLAPDANEEHGEVFGFSLVYSGNFLAQAEVDQFGTSRVTMGINPFDFEWLLEPGAQFQAPEAVLVFSGSGLGEMSRTYHRLYRQRLCRGDWRDRPRPILINNWEATYFDFDAAKIASIARAGRELGLELFVLDDGWFGRRDDDRSSLGDWVVHGGKLPGGLAALAAGVGASGMDFGLWFEPEMVSPDSDLYRAHPDWCLHVPGRPRSESRHQLVLDFSREEVCAHIVNAVSAILASAPIRYVKWDMNRHHTEVGSAALPAERQRETAHRFMLGLYRVLEEITTAFPHILFESCSGGGGRFDPGMLFYMPQTWTSDNTDAVSRLKIQYGTSLVYPLSAMGAHVSASPNHQVGRVTSLELRGHVAMSGNFGYELDLSRLSAGETQLVREQVAFYREIRGLVQTGDFYRLRSPFEGNETAWMIVSEDRSAAVVFHFRGLGEANAPQAWLRLRGLDPVREYRVEETGESLGGDLLMNAGLLVPQLEGDFKSVVWRLTMAEM